MRFPPGPAIPAQLKRISRRAGELVMTAFPKDAEHDKPPQRPVALEKQPSREPDGWSQGFAPSPRRYAPDAYGIRGPTGMASRARISSYTGMPSPASMVTAMP